MSTTTNSSEPTLSRAQKNGIITAITCTGSAALGFGYSAPLISQNLERMTSSGALLGWLISIGAVTTILLTPFVPKLLNRFNAKWIMVLALIFGALSIPLFKIFMYPEAWFVIRFIEGCAFTILFVVAETWINQLAPEHLRGRILGMYGTALAGGFGLGSGIAVFTGIDGWFPFLFGANLFLLGLIPFILLRTATNVVPPPKEHSRFSSTLKIILAAPSLIACGIVFGAIEQVIFHFLPVYATRLGNTEHMARILLLIATLGNALFQYPMGMLTDRINREKLMVFLMGVAFIGPVFMALAGTNFYLLAGFVFFYIGLTTAIYTVGLVLLAERFKGHTMSAANAAFIFAYGIGSFIVPPICGIMMDVFRPYGFMWTLAALGACGFILVWVRNHLRKPRQNG
ncbi:MAG: hypothetical protein COA69_01115 [Robiginitomaculum sp.]|nr:MAG: hypothetical protein COA69_01115 [Robiginitomaculum sp.]